MGARVVLLLFYAALLSAASVHTSYFLLTPSAGVSDTPSANSCPTRQSDLVSLGTGVGGNGSGKGRYRVVPEG